jgi:hypothetical protein
MKKRKMIGVRYVDWLGILYRSIRGVGIEVNVQSSKWVLVYGGFRCMIEVVKRLYYPMICGDMAYYKEVGVCGILCIKKDVCYWLDGNYIDIAKGWAGQRFFMRELSFGLGNVLVNRIEIKEFGWFIKERMVYRTKKEIIKREYIKRFLMV